jgi:cellulose synthase/poly-beta-1,6-N-acetylglucosamine synthase-like glycosyltransferase
MIALCAVAVLYPFVIYPLVLQALPQHPQAPGTRPAASASLLFCAYNEGAALPGKIANLVAIKALHPDLEILAFDDGSSDDTAEQLARHPDVLTLVRGNRSGKAHGMKQLAALATGEILIFTDANVILAEKAVAKLLAYYSDPQVGGVLGSLHYLGEKESATASVGSLYWRLEERLKDLESRSGNVMGADGSIFSIRRMLYPTFPDTVLDDLTVSMAVIFAGKRLIKARDVIVSEHMVASRQDEYRRKVRIAARAWHTHRYLRPDLRRMAAVDQFKYVSRKVIRWFGAVFLSVGAIATLAFIWVTTGPQTAVALFLLGMIILAMGFRATRGPFASVLDIVIAYFATLQGIVQAIGGRTFVVWNPAKSR